MDKKKKGGILKSLSNLFGSLFRFGDKRPELSEVAANSDEALLSPGRQIIKNFFGSKLGVLGLVTFVFIFAAVFGVSSFSTYDETLHETTLQNLKPSTNYLNVSKSLDPSKVIDIQSGVSFSIALDNEGKLHYWGTNPGRYVVSNIIELTKDEKIKQIAVGDKHVLALTESNQIIGVGENSFGQAELSYEVNSQIMGKKIKKIGAGVGFSVVLLESGQIYVWGSTMLNQLGDVPKRIQGNVDDFTVGTFNILVKTKEGTLDGFGQAGTPVVTIPDEYKDGSIKVDQFTIATNSVLILDTNGKLHSYGAITDGLTTVPESDVKFTSINSSRLSFYAVDANGKAYSWGNGKFGLTSIPSSASTSKQIFSDFFQTYSISENGKITAWGNKGFALGSDDLGRDILERLIQGGRSSLTVGAVSVIISTVIGVLAGLISGFYGKWIDNVIMRVAEVVSSFPFLPLAITLSALLPDDTSQNTRLLMIMLILGVISWPGVARLVRGQILAEREKDFVLAARALGLKESVIIVKHILPSVLNLVVVSMTLSYASSLLTEAGLSYLGFGVKPPIPSWGNMLTGVGNSITIEYYWWRWLFPALCVLITALSVNLIGDALRDAMDPKSNQK